ncbi:MAG TPA: metalloregulator ArsR/SmtB family transcription factor [Candidatus Eisenbacteria bacterium]|nr:metalloregulator ArsR/SmtB family transcription factor [Candidatus Eisenbacteria bacterium]
MYDKDSVTVPRRPPSADDRALAKLARALGHPARVAILRRLLVHGACVCGAIVEELPLAQATVSQHLKVLRQAGFIRGEIDGPRVCYCVAPEALARLHHLLDAMPMGGSRDRKP